MGPRQLQSQIHSDYSSSSSVWTSYRTGISGLYGTAAKKDDFHSHLIREYNRKIDRLNQSTGLFISPFDAGYGFIGTEILPPFGEEQIQGFAFPNETLSAPAGASYSWTIDGNVVGSDSYFVPTIHHIGKTIYCLVDDILYSAVVWHPNQIAATKAFWLASQGAYTSGGTLAQDEELVSEWYDIINSGKAVGSLGNATLHPSYEDGNSYTDADIFSASIQSDGDDYQIVDQTTESVFNSAQYAYCFMGLKDINNTSGYGTHTAFSVLGSASAPILNFGTRISNSNSFYVQAKKSDGSLVSLTGSASNSNYNVLGCEALFGDSTLALRVNGSNNVSGALNGSSTTGASTVSMFISRGSSLNTRFNSYLTCIILLAGNSKLSNQDRNRIERFIGLLGNVDVPLN